MICHGESMITSLRIDRFRGIHSLALEDLGRVNVFIGENGCGKTTVLEAIFSIAHPTIAGALPYIANTREMLPLNLEKNDALASMFYESDFSEQPEFEFIANEGVQRLSLTPILELGGEVPLTNDVSTGTLSNLPKLRGVEVVFYPNPNQRLTYDLVLQSSPDPTRSSYQVIPASVGHQGIGGYFVPARTSMHVQNTANLLTQLYENKLSDKFVKMVRTLDPRTIAFQPGIRGATPVVLVDVGLSVMLPLNVLGDGFCRVVLMATGLFATDSAVLIVDEIDSGLHSTAMTEVWKGICDLSVKEDKQIFCTTHNEEMLLRTIEAFEGSPELLRIFRIDRLKDGQSRATKYTYDELHRADVTAVDIR
jgi:energy-coupling factor transporter ATP-binding protein EcfA2